MMKFGFEIKDLIDTNKVSESNLNTLNEWLKTTKLPAYNYELLALFLIACNHNLENTKKCALQYYFTRKDAPELFNNRILSRSDIQHQLRILEYCVMPERTIEGHVIILHRLLNKNPSEYHMDVAMKILFMTMDTSVYDNPPTGVVVLFDMQGVGIMHLTRVKISAVKKFFHFVQEALPLQLKSVHIMNVVWFFDKILKLIKPFYKPELLELLHTHHSNVNMEYFYDTCIPRRCLPSDYGGYLPSVEELHKENQKKMEEMATFYREEETMRN